MDENGEDKKFETIKVQAALKELLLDDQEALRKTRGRKVSITRLITEMREAWIAASDPQAKTLPHEGHSETHGAGSYEGTKVPVKNSALNPTTLVPIDIGMYDNAFTVISGALEAIAQTLARLESRMSEINTSGSNHVHDESDDAHELVAEPLHEEEVPNYAEIPKTIRGQRKDPAKASKGDHPSHPQRRH